MAVVFKELPSSCKVFKFKNLKINCNNLKKQSKFEFVAEFWFVYNDNNVTTLLSLLIISFFTKRITLTFTDNLILKIKKQEYSI